MEEADKKDKTEDDGDVPFNNSDEGWNEKDIDDQQITRRHRRWERLRWMQKRWMGWGRM